MQTKISHGEKELKAKSEQLSSKREEAVAVEKELSVRTKDVEDVRRALESVSFEEGKMEALQKVAFPTALFIFYTNRHSTHNLS